MSSDQIATVVRILREVVPDGVLGVYLHGSAILGSLRPTSDLDVFAVTSRRTAAEERRELIQRLLPVSGSGDPTGRSRSIDIAMVAQDDLRPWRYPARLDFQYGDWLRRDFASGNDAPWDPANPDLVILLEMVLQANCPLFGRPPADLFGPIPWADVSRAMVDTIPDLRSYLDGDERNVVLTFARIWATLATGRFHSKDGAAAWAILRLPEEHRAALAHASSLYTRGVAAEDWGDLMPRVRPLVDRLIAEIGGATRTPQGPPGPKA